MRLLLLSLLVAVPAAAQPSIEGDGVVPVEVSDEDLASEWDLAPVVAASGFEIAGAVLAGAICVGAAVWVFKDAESRGEQVDLCTLNLVGYAAVGVALLVGGGVASLGSCGADGGGAAPLVAGYPAAGLAAFAAGELTDDHRRQLASGAEARGRMGVVLRRLVQERSGVGRGRAGVRMEIAVVDAQSGRLLPLTDDALTPTTLLSVPAGQDLAETTETALQGIVR